MYIVKIVAKFHGSAFKAKRGSKIRFPRLSGEFVLTRRWQDKIPLARSHEPDVPPKRTKKARLVPEFGQKSVAI